MKIRLGVLAALVAAPALGVPAPRQSPPDDPLRDRILGTLLGSAIGDAMGAPTEMWSRDQIQAEYGFVRDLEPLMREPSPEGVWTLNLRAGATTDDTRWKGLAVEYLTGSGEPVAPADPELEAAAFAALLSRRFGAEIETLRRLRVDDPAPELIDGVMRLQWLQEWDSVARAWLAGDLPGYTRALDRFYGGEMVCAGLLFSPALGAYYPGEPERAYRNAFAVDVYDLGYARDVSAITAGMVAAALEPGSSPEGILSVVAEVDPHGYFESRLVGRQAFQMLREARRIVHQARGATLDSEAAAALAGGDPGFPAHPWVRAGLTPLEALQLLEAYRLLDERQQRMPFHAGEIHLVNLTALLFAQFDFTRALEFVVNYGRDNDTTAAVTGAILGAHRGAAALPEAWASRALERNRALGLDLEAMADRMVTAIRARAGSTPDAARP